MTYLIDKFSNIHSFSNQIKGGIKKNMCVKKQQRNENDTIQHYFRSKVVKV